MRTEVVDLSHYYYLFKMIQLTEEEFSIVYNALALVNDPNADETENVEEIIIAERQAWKAIQDAAYRYSAAHGEQLP